MSLIACSATRLLADGGLDKCNGRRTPGEAPASVDVLYVAWHRLLYTESPLQILVIHSCLLLTWTEREYDILTSADSLVNLESMALAGRNHEPVKGRSRLPDTAPSGL